MFEVRRLARRLWHAPCTARARCFLHIVQEAVELSMLNWSLGGVAAISSEEDFPQMYAAEIEKHAGPVGQATITFRSFHYHWSAVLLRCCDFVFFTLAGTK